MGLLKGYNNANNKTRVLYGLYSHSNIYDQLNSRQSLNYTKRYVLSDLKKSQISKQSYLNYFL